MYKFLTIVVIVLAFIVMPAVAQDETPAPTVTEEVTAEVTPEVVETEAPTVEPTLEPTPTEEPPSVPVGDDVSLDENETIINIWALLTALGGIGVSAFVAGLFTAPYLIKQLRSNKEAMSALEVLFGRLSADKRAALFELLNTVDDAVEIGKEILDGVPVKDKP